MARDSFVVVANEYDTEADAHADYVDVRTKFAEHRLLDIFDAFVGTRAADGHVEIVKPVEEPAATPRGRDSRSGLPSER